MASPSRRRYTDEEKAQALAVLDAFGGDIARTQRVLGIPDSTLESWRDGRGTNKAIPALREEKKLELASKLDEIAKEAAGFALGKLDAASVRDLMGAVKISVEMGNLLRSEPTSIAETRNLTSDERRDRISELMDAARYRAGAGTSDAIGTKGTGSSPRN